MEDLTQISAGYAVKRKKSRYKKNAGNNIFGDEFRRGKKQSDYRRNSQYQTLFEYFNPDE
jgi:hypothetical protein